LILEEYADTCQKRGRSIGCEGALERAVECR